MTKRVAIAGSSGLIGGALRRHLTARGDQVVSLVRRPARASEERRWDPARGRLDPMALDGLDAIVNLAGVGIGDRRWNDVHKQAVEQSRIETTDTISVALAIEHDRSGRSIRFVNGSAVGFYGDRGDEVLTEDSAAGDDFLAGVVSRWEAATQPAQDAAVPVAIVRTGLVMARGAGAFQPLLRLARLGLGGPLGSGREWWPYVTLVDEVRALTHLIDHPDLTGVFNVAAPEAKRQKEIAAAIGAALRRPSVLPAPRIALRVVVGEFADSILASQRVTPSRLLAHGFEFEYPDLQSSVTWLVQA
ncbi:MAG: TIGR01777 family oxidoreductase [Micrococcales bacterium]|nr:TIGR01777 family oxidoreductase [Micrococcales bacterium]